MSRTRHRTWETMKREDTRRSSRPSLTKNGGRYNSSNFDYSEGNGRFGWLRWLLDYCGYRKQRKRRHDRKVMKRYDRRAQLRKSKRRDLEEW